MARIFPISIVQGIKGTMCSHDGQYFQTNSSSGKVFAVKLCNPSNAEPTADQLAQREKFKNQSALASAWLNANKPTKTLPKGTDLYQEAQKLKKSYKYSSVTQVVYHYMTTDGAIKLPSQIEEEGGDNTL